ncbi:MAG: hypothetical protein ACREGI_02430 [Candidatus Levyibacteriota bacterium]
MITVPEAAKKIVERSRYLSEAMSKGLINLSSLARYIKPEVEEMLLKDVSESSIIMALKRLETQLKPQVQYKNVFKTPPEMIVRSNLTEITATTSISLPKKCAKIFELYAGQQKYFFAFTEGITESTMIISQELKQKILAILEGENIVATFSNLSSITIRQPKEITYTPGIVYFFLKSLAWEGINIMEVVSTYLELTIILEDKEVNRAFGILKSLFN